MLVNPAHGSLVTEGNLFDFFRGRVETAAAHQGDPVSRDAVYYLSGLLAEHGRRDPDEHDDSTLVELRQRAAEASYGEAVTLWKRIGDHTLMALGYFSENLDRRRVSRDYYAEMGQGAYARLSRWLRDPGEPFSGVFGEIADRYRACTELIQEVRDESRESDHDVLRLYEEWLATGSPRVAERLRKLGVVPVRTAAAG